MTPTRTDLVGVGADLEPGTLLAAYRTGLFPMPVGSDGPLGWWSPDPRGVLPLDGLSVSRSLRRSLRRYEIRVDTAFETVMRACGGSSRAGGWITEPFVVAYTRLHELGWAHSVEAWTETVSSSAACTASRSAVSSPASRCSSARWTRRRSLWSTWSAD